MLNRILNVSVISEFNSETGYERQIPANNDSYPAQTRSLTEQHERGNRGNGTNAIESDTPIPPDRPHIFREPGTWKLGMRSEPPVLVCRHLPGSPVITFFYKPSVVYVQQLKPIRSCLNSRRLRILEPGCRHTAPHPTSIARKGNA